MIKYLSFSIAGSAGLFPSCLMPNAVEKELAQHLASLASYRYGAWLFRMLQLSVVSFCPALPPSVFFQHLQDLSYFVFLHLYFSFYNAKVIKRILSCNNMELKGINIITLPFPPGGIPTSQRARL